MMNEKIERALLKAVEGSTATDENYISESYALSSVCHSTTANIDSRRLAELESQNSNLQRLVAELLIANQQLRERATKNDS